MAKSWTMIALAVAIGLCRAGPAAAQTPSADQIIQSLRPPAPPPPPPPVTRGIRPMNPAADAPAAVSLSPSIEASAPVAPPPPQPSPDPLPDPPPPRMASQAPPPPPPPTAPSVNLTVQFATGSAELAPAAAQTLDELGRALSSSTLAGYRFRIEGHTDTVGSREHNRVLSEARAAKVLDYLVGRWNIDRAVLTAAGMGQDHLLVPTGPNVAEPRNRRVTVINLGA